jgi:hypothetical protein
VVPDYLQSGWIVRKSYKLQSAIWFRKVDCDYVDPTRDPIWTVLGVSKLGEDAIKVETVVFDLFNYKFL